MRSSAAPWAVSARRGSPLCCGLAELAVDLVALGLHDLAQLLGDLVVDAAEVEAVEPLLALLAQPLEQVAHALHVLALPVAEALLQQAAQRGVQVAVVQQVVGDLLEDRVGVEVEPDLGAVPAAVAEPRRRHDATVSVRPVAPGSRAGGSPAAGSGDAPGRAGRAGADDAGVGRSIDPR